MIEFWPRKKAPIEEKPDKSQNDADSEMQKPSPEILGKWDKKMLEEGITNIVEQMLKDFDRKLPDTIILPDTSARPLFFALKPVFVQLEQQIGVPAPTCFAFNAKRTPITLKLAEDQRRLLFGKENTIDSSEELKKHYIDMGTDKIFSGETFIESSVKIAEPETMKDARAVMKERAQQILARVGQSTDKLRIAIVDEYATYQATTAGEIRRAFGMPDMRAYAVFAENTDSVQAGVTVDSSLEDTMNPRRDFKAKFTYSGTNAVGVTKSKRGIQERFSEHIPPNEYILKQKKQLQDEMRAVGERVAARVLEHLKQRQNDI